MATRVREELVDDLDGSDAIDSFSFSFEGVEYAIDLNEVHAKELSEDMGKWTARARRVGGKKRTPAKANGNGSGGKGKTKEMREWARANGWPDLSNIGRIPYEAEEAFRRHQEQ